MRIGMHRLAMIGTLAATLALGASAIAQPDSGLRFRGVGASRKALDEMQLKPFDQSLWSNLSDWSGTPVAGAATEGKVVLIVTWASWHKVSHPAVRAAEALSEKFKDQGLIVVGVHNPRGFETAPAVAKDLGVAFPFAADKDGKFRAGLKADQDPNLYFIDRAGNLRYAQVETASADDAATRLIGETAEQARTFPTNLASKRAAQEKDRWKTSDLKGGFGPGAKADVEIEAIDDEVYSKVKWPYVIGKVEKDDILERVHATPPKVAPPSDEDVLQGPFKHSGRLTVIYWVDPRNTDTLRVIPVMNQVQDQYRRDVALLLATAKFGEALKSDSGGEDSKVKQRNQELLEQMLKTERVNHPMTTAILRGDHTEFSEQSLRPRLSNQRETFGFAVILSSDDKIRWLGDPYSQDLRRSIDKLIALDPGVQARRKAEEGKTTTGK